MPTTTSGSGCASGDTDRVLRAERAALAGDLVDAAHHADPVLADDEAEVALRVRAARVLAQVHAHRGMLGDAAAVHRWVAAVAPHSLSPAAAIALVGTGTPPPPDQDHSPSATDRPRPPTLHAGADRLVGRAIAASLRPGGSAAALSDLTRAAETLACHAGPVLADDTPAALAALVALSRGEPDIARFVLGRAVEADLGGDAFRRRHLLLRAWADMGLGNLAAARRGLDDAVAQAGPRHTRDELLAVALEAGIARRSGDTGELLALWARVREAVLAHPVDLWSLLAIGEMAVVAGRLGQLGWLAPHLEAGDALLDGLGGPVLYAAPWHWSAFLAAVAAADPPAAHRHATSLAETATDPAVPADSLVGLLARCARVWLRILAGVVDADEVAQAAEALARAGMAYDGARLAKEGAGRAADRLARTTLLGLGRTLAASTSPAASASGTGVAATRIRAAASPSAAGEGVPASRPAASGTRTPTRTHIPATRPGARGVPSTSGSSTVTLREREREVAELLLQGLTHRQIGDRLFITAKTVEFHVGKMRARTGSTTRADFFAALRRALRD